jgi:hypothetical protein
MDVDKPNSRVKVHIDKKATSNPDIMPIGTWALEIMSVDKDTKHWSIYQNLKQFDLKKSYIVLSGDTYINQNIKR